MYVTGEGQCEGDRRTPRRQGGRDQAPLQALCVPLLAQSARPVGLLLLSHSPRTAGGRQQGTT